MARPPLKVSASIRADDGITVSWEASAGATSYKVFRGTTPNPGSSTLVASGITDLEWADTATDPESVRYYWIKATDGVGDSDYSGMATGWREQPVPAAATLSGTPEPGVMVLEWAEVPGALFYRVFRDGVAVGYVAAGPDPLEYEDSAITPHVEYDWQVFAGNYSGESGSNVVTDEVPDPIPEAPDDLAATDGTEVSKVVVTWSAPAYATEYDIYRDNVLLSANWPFTTYEDVTTPGGISYTYKVKARGASGTSGFSNQDTGYAAALAAPTGVTASDTFLDSVIVDWAVVPGATGYKVRRNGSVIGTPATNTFEDDTAVPGTTYTYDVIATNAVEESAVSDSDTGSRVIISAPTGLTASSDQVGEIDLSWTAATGALSYTIFRDAVEVASGVTGTTWADTSVSNCVDYSYTLKSVRNDNVSAASSADTGRSLPSGEFCLIGGVTTSGGESGYDQSFPFCGGSLDVYFNADSPIKDELEILVDGVSVWNSGCITGEATTTLGVSVGSHTLRIIVHAHCDSGQSGTTIWSFAVTCD